MARSYRDQTLKQLFLASGHYCAFPDCTTPIVEFTESGPVVLGEIAHIAGSSNDGPRPDPTLTESQKNSYENLIVLCAHHHTLIDKVDSNYSVETLSGWKRAAEVATAERLSVGAAAVTFVELATVCIAFADGDIYLPSTPMVAVPPQDKMDANSLTQAVRATMIIGLAQAPQVADFIRRQALLSTRFPDRLRAGFVSEYTRLRTNGVTGDLLFFGLLEFGVRTAAQPHTGMNQLFIYRAAAAAVLCHLFEMCDVFEMPR